MGQNSNCGRARDHAATMTCCRDDSGAHDHEGREQEAAGKTSDKKQTGDIDEEDGAAWSVEATQFFGVRSSSERTQISHLHIYCMIIEIDIVITVPVPRR